MLVDGIQELLAPLESQWDVACIEVLHVVAGFHVVVYEAEIVNQRERRREREGMWHCSSAWWIHLPSTSRSKRLDCVELILFHQGAFATLDDWDSFSRMNLVWRD